MHLIIGLGNPGKKYKRTRHNIGFLCLEHLRGAWNFPLFQKNTSFQAECSEGRINNEKVILARPTTFMNHSGESVQKLARFYRIEPQNIAVIHDDLDISLGDVRESFGSRSAGHHGVESIIETLGTKDFLRFRIGLGIRNKENLSEHQREENTKDVVLGPLTDEERDRTGALFPDIAKTLEAWICNAKEKEEDA